jgi:hypothetical protein
LRKNENKNDHYIYMHFGWTCGANKVVFGPKYHWWKQIQISKSKEENLRKNPL